MEQSKGLEELEILALEHLVDLLDYESRHNCRQVSRKLKACVEDIGLSVRIDTRNPESSGFCQNVNVSEAHILYMKAFNLSRKDLESWKTAILSGPIDSFWLSNGLQMNCSNLRVLIIRDDCLASQDFSGPTQPLPVFNHLTTVQVSLTELSYKIAVTKIEQLTNGGSVNRIYRKMDARVQKNMFYLMQTVRSRVLKVFHVFAFVKFKSDKDKTHKVSWEHEPLFELLQSHRNTLEEVVLQNLFSGEANHEGKIYELPMKLQTLVYSASGQEHFLTYWKALLLTQRTLKHLTLHDKIHSSEFLPLLKSVLFNNTRTLTSLLVGVRCEVTITTLDIKMLMGCEVLECLVILAMSSVRILNLNLVPLGRLKTLLLLGRTRINEDFDAVRFMQDSNLGCLRIEGISTTGPFQDTKYALKFIKMALRSRTLNAFYFEIAMEIKDRRGWSLTRASDSDDVGFLNQLIKLKSDETGNLSCTFLGIWDTHDHAHSIQLETDTNLQSNEPYVSSAVDLEYLGILSSFEMLAPREQPFNIPRNKDSYSIWINQKNNLFKIIPNTQSYTSRVDDITRVQPMIMNSEWISKATLRQ